MKYLKIITLLILFFATSLIQSAEGTWYTVDKIIALVNSDPILYSDLAKRVALIKKKQKLSSKEKKVIYQATLDEFINESLLFQAADREYIIVSDEKVESKITELMKYSGSKSRKQFIASMEREQKLPFEFIKEELRKQLIIEQIMVYAMTFTPPNESEAKEWYKKNKKQLLQVKFQHILIVPKSDSFTAEKEANSSIASLRERAIAGESFASLAHANSMDKASAKLDGYIDWIGFGQLDPKFAYYVYNMKKTGEISPVFKSSFGYHIVRYHGRRYMPYEQIRERVFQMIAQQERVKQYQKWVKGERNKSKVIVYLKDFDKYIAAKEKK